MSRPVALLERSRQSRRPQRSQLSSRLGADPVAIGLVGNLNRPGGNLTGVSSLNVQVTPKRLPRIVLRDKRGSEPLCISGPGHPVIAFSSIALRA